MLQEGAQWNTVGAQVARAHLHLLTPEVTVYRGHVTPTSNLTYHTFMAWRAGDN